MPKYSLSRAIWRKSTAPNRTAPASRSQTTSPASSPYETPKTRTGPKLIFTPAAWRTFTHSVRNEAHAQR